MLSVTCPSCGTTLSLEQRWLRKQVKCGNCGDNFFVAGQSAPSIAATASESLSLPYDPVPIYRQRRRHKSYLARAISITIHAGITCATVYVGYRMVMSRQAAPRQQVVARPAPRELALVEPPRVPKKQATEKEIVRVVIPAGPPRKPEVLPFKDVPIAVPLPPVEDKAANVLIPYLMGGTTFTLLTNNGTFVNENQRLSWHPENGEVGESIVAALVIVDDALRFRWADDVRDEAVMAVWNSVVLLSSGGVEHGVALRAAEEGELFAFNLKKPEQFVSGKCAFSPPADQIVFELTGFGSFPPNNIAANPPPKLFYRDSLDVRYQGADNAKTTVKLERRGNTAAVRFSSLYMLPTGDIEPMSISKGTRKLRELRALENDANWSKANLRSLQDNLKVVQKKLRALQQAKSRPAAWHFAVGSAQADIAAGTARIARAEQLIKDLPAIQREIRELERVAKVAQQLHNTGGVTYRFFTIVDGYEVDLVVAK